MKRIFVSAILVWLSAAPCAAAGSPAAETEDPLITVAEAQTVTQAEQAAFDAAPAAAVVAPAPTQSDEEAIFRKEFYQGDPLAPAQPDKPSVNISEEFGVAEGVGSRKNIDGYLGEFENPYAPMEATYEGSRSELRDEINERRGR